MLGNIQWRRVLAASITAAALISITLLAPIVVHAIQEHAQRRANQPNPNSASNAEQRSIVQALLLESKRFFVQPLDADGKLLPMPEPGSMVLLDTSAVICDPNAPDKNAYPECSGPPSFFSVAAMDYDAEIPRKLRLELVAANRKSVPIPDPKMPKVVYRSRADIEGLVRSDGGWESFHTIFPGASGYIEFSRAVTSADGRYALIYEARYCHGVCFSGGDLHYFVRTGNTWRLIRSAGIWVS
jgi:hypothetical protein